MGSTRLDRELRRARTAYLGALYALDAAVRDWIRLDVPLHPDRTGALPLWTPEQIRATIAVATGWQELVVRRRVYEQLRRQFDASL